MKFSGKKINKAGDSLRNISEPIKDKEQFDSCMDVLSFWRLAHEVPLERAFLKLQEVTLKKDKTAIFAKRLKRYISIVKKLQRFDRMKLKNMQDMGGCRTILTNEKKLYQTVRELKKLPEFKWVDGKFRTKNYLKKPKPDGYRGYHIIGNFTDKSGNRRKIEVQLRTRIQHYWATALEIVDLFTGQALKSNQGHVIWKNFFQHVGEQFAIMDSIHLFDSLTVEEKFTRYKNVLDNDKSTMTLCKITNHFCNQLQIFDKLDAFAGSLKIIDNHLVKRPSAGFALLKIDTSKQSVLSEFFKEQDSQLAEKKYIEAEKEAAGSSNKIVALVSTTAVGGIKEAYPNYFADSTEFGKHLLLTHKACGQE